MPALLENVPLRVRAEIIFQHDGAPAHFSRQVREFLNAHYPGRWIGRGGPIIWPARSPDFDVLDYFVWGYIKNLVEDRRDSTEAEVSDARIETRETRLRNGGDTHTSVYRVHVMRRALCARSSVRE